jgi:integrase
VWRDVPLPASLVGGLRAWSAESEYPGADQLVFPNTVGRAENKDNLRNRHMRAAAERAGAAWMGHHTLRHTFASLHIARGTNVVQLSRLLGCHSPAFTLCTYAHLLEDGVGEASDLEAELTGVQTEVQTSGSLGASDVRPIGTADLGEVQGKAR